MHLLVVSLSSYPLHTDHEPLGRIKISLNFLMSEPSSTLTKFGKTHVFLKPLRGDAVFKNMMSKAAAIRGTVRVWKVRANKGADNEQQCASSVCEFVN
jgi:hypothetical protein